jgi:hypothetical protein
MVALKTWKKKDCPNLRAASTHVCQIINSIFKENISKDSSFSSK